MKLKYYLRGLGIGVVVTAIIMSFTRQPEKLTDAQIKLRALELGMVEESVLADLQEDNELVSNEDFSQKDNFQEDLSSIEEVEEATTEEDGTMENNSETEASVEESSEVEEASTAEVSGEENSTVEASNTEESDIEASQQENNIEEKNEADLPENTVTESTDINVDEKTNSNSPQIPEGEVVENYIVIPVEKGNGSEIVSRRLYEAGLVSSEVGYNQFLVINGYDRKLSVGNHEIPVGATEEEMARILCGMN